jgi:predicted DNA-binding transcriptional regulator AlpA
MPLKPLDPVIPRPVALRDYLHVSLVTAWRRERSTAGWPEAIDIGGGRLGYRLSAIRCWLESRVTVAGGRKPDRALEARRAKRGGA